MASVPHVLGAPVFPGKSVPLHINMVGGRKGEKRERASEHEDVCSLVVKALNLGSGKKKKIKDLMTFTNYLSKLELVQQKTLKEPPPSIT